MTIILDFSSFFDPVFNLQNSDQSQWIALMTPQSWFLSSSHGFQEHATFLSSLGLNLCTTRTDICGVINALLPATKVVVVASSTLSVMNCDLQGVSKQSVYVGAPKWSFSINIWRSSWFNFSVFQKYTNDKMGQYSKMVLSFFIASTKRILILLIESK